MSWSARVCLVVVAGAAACSRAEREAPAMREERPIPRPQAVPPVPKPLGKLAPAAGWAAVGVDRLGEVPDSSWFTNRNAVRPVSPEAIRRGPGPHPRPRDGARWAIVGTKETGYAIGFRARDERGAEYYLKFDPRGHDEVETGADVATQRLLFAAGYNVPENDVVYVARERLSIAPGALARDEDGERPLRDDDVTAMLARAAREPDGRYRALASRVLPGEPLGGIEPKGVRPGDANDAIAHQDRRDMRGLYSIAAWLNHTDIKAKNSLEVWIPDRGDPSRGRVAHYLLDFGKALGAMARIDRRPEVGFAHEGDTDVKVDLGPFPDLRGLGWLESEQFDPAQWKTLAPWLPFQAADRFDRFWGARIVMSFTPQQIRAALEAARYTEPRTVEQVLRVLLERQRKVGVSFFQEVAPLDRFRVERGALCYDDLWARHRLGGGAATYVAELVREKDDGEPWRDTAGAGADGVVCHRGLPGPARGQTLAFELRVARPGQDLPPVVVTLEAPASGPPRVVALDRR
ncbi:MAG TPA: hypothetical protein VMZ28_24795 [Kofleriaceae bacterium]|nr:hypothetical protein [Kofleriaceae bacterium]